MVQPIPPGRVSLRQGLRQAGQARVQAPGQQLLWNQTQSAGPHTSFTVGHMYGMYQEHREEKLYTTNMMLGTVGGMAFLLSCLNLVAFAFFAGLLNIDSSDSFASARGAAYGGQAGAAGSIPQSAPAGGSYGSI